MRLRRPLTLFLIVAALCALAPASAFGTERVVRPVQTYSAGSWTSSPSSASTHGVLAETVAAPGAPDTSSGFISTGVKTIGEVGFAAPAITTSETVAGATLQAYLETGTNRSLTLELRSGIWPLRFIVIPAGQPAGWYALQTFGAPTLAQLGDLRMRATVAGNGASTDVKIFAAYVSVSVSTTAPATAPTGTGEATPGTPTGSSDTPTGDGSGPTGTTGTSGGGEQATPDAAAAITLPVQTLKLAGEGALAVPLTCRLAAGCTGTVTTRLVGSAQSARRRKASPKKARNRFRLAAGQSKRVPVQLDRRTSRFIKRKGRAKVAITIAIDGADPVTKQVTVTERRGAARRVKSRTRGRGRK